MTVVDLVIYLETSAARAAGWPRVSATIERLGLIVRALQAELFVVELVEVELEEVWLRDLHATISGVKPLDRLLSGIVDQSPAVEVPDETEIRKGYSRAAAAAKEKLSARSAPVTTRPVKDFAVMAARRQPPFKDRDEGFRDAVIFWSIIDHVLALGRTSCILIAEDESFSKPEMLAAANEAGITLNVYRGIRKYIDAIHSQLEIWIRQSLEQDQDRAREALLEIKESIVQFITENLVFYEHDLATFFGVVRGINRIAVRDIQNVRTSLDFALPTTEMDVKISFEAAVELHLSVERYPAPASRTIRVGEELPPGWVGPLTGLLVGPQRSEEVCSKTVEMQASAVRTALGNYEHVQLETAQVQHNEPPIFGR